MKIQSIEVYLIDLGHRNVPYVRVLTDEGVHGVGEAYSIGPDRATVAAIEDLAEWLIGRDPLAIEGLWQLMYAGSRFPGGSILNAAISGIEHALWDIKGKALGVPVYELIGGRCRDRVRVYQSAGGDTPEALAESARRLVRTYGYTALKMFPFDRRDEPLWHDMGLARAMRGAEARIRAVREAVGDDVDIALDAHAQIFQPSTALTLCQVLQPFHPLFLEEPLRPENREALGQLHAKSPIPIATGEMLYTKYEFRDLLANAAADIVQPDVCLMGGLWEMKKVAAMAEADVRDRGAAQPLRAGRDRSEHPLRAEHAQLPDPGVSPGRRPGTRRDCRRTHAARRWLPGGAHAARVGARPERGGAQGEGGGGGIQIVAPAVPVACGRRIGVSVEIGPIFRRLDQSGISG